jgi:hypothetical protein
VAQTPEERAERARANARRWYHANKDRAKEARKQWAAQNRDKVNGYIRKWTMRVEYGITDADYERMRAEQDAKCALCGKHESLCRVGRLVVDHMHCSGKVRSLLCPQCNTGIGMLMEDPEVLERAAAYVRKHRNEIH